nr:ACT domain-containing protein [Shewanella dokdonensis]
MTLAIHPTLYSIHSFAADTPIPAEVFMQPSYFLAKTREELSVVIDARIKLNSLEQESNWRCLEILVQKGFSTAGIHSMIATTLAEANISIFSMSTFDTDYILVKWDKLDAAVQALRGKGYQVIEYDR